MMFNLLSIAVASKVKHKVADWVCRIPAVVKNIAERLKPGYCLIATKRNQQIGKFMPGYAELRDGFRQGHEYRVPW